MMNKVHFPLVWDNTMVQAFTCKRHGYLQYMRHWKLLEQSVHLIAGAAYASALERLRNAFFFEHKSADVALEEAVVTLIREYGNFEPRPDQEKKSWLSCIEALLYYVEKFPLHSEQYKPILLEGRNSVEFSFVVPLDVLHPESGEPILYSGRADQIVQCSNTGNLFLEDDKTASQLGDSFGRQFDQSGQFSGYVYAAREYGLDIRGILIRGICFYKDRIDHQVVLTYRSENEIKQWKRATEAKIREAILCWQNEYYPENLGSLCTAYGKCPFNDFCKHQDVDFLRTNFERREWNPHTRREVLFPIDQDITYEVA